MKFHGMLVHVSAGYLPARGWLHTCYSPVRRSPSRYCYLMLPLDLHVLSLSLAFILSQDQTLHCNSYFQKLFWQGHVYESRLIVVYRFSLATLFIQYLKELFFSVSQSLHFWSESGCKDKSFFFILPNLFQSFFKLFLKASKSLVPASFVTCSLSKAGAKITR